MIDATNLVGQLLIGAIAIGAIALPAPALGQQPAPVTLDDYTVREGDTCASISEARFGDRTRYDIIHQYNPGMGPPPHSLRAGTVLRLPRTATPVGSGPDAHVTEVMRVVQARSPSETEWARAARGLDLYAAWRVNTEERSAAEVTFRDTSVVQLRENTLVIIFGATAGAARRRDTTDAQLDSGALRTRLGSLRLSVSTPSARADVQGGSSLIGVDAAGTSRVCTFDGGEASVATPTGAGRVRVRPGFGSKVVRGRRPEPPRPLPPSPTWDVRPELAVALSANGATLRGSWVPVPNARSYRVEVSATADGSGLVAATEVPATITRLELEMIPAGDYFVRLSTIDRDFFESRPSEAAAAHVVLARLEGPSGQPIDATAADPFAPAPPIVLELGSRLVAPDTMRCAGGDRDLAQSFVFDRAGVQVVRCVDDAGHEAPTLRLTVTVPPRTERARPRR